MNEIIKNIEAAQLKETVPSFNLGDTVRVSAKIKEGTAREFRFSRELLLRDRTAAFARLSLLERAPTVLV